MEILSQGDRRSNANRETRNNFRPRWANTNGKAVEDTKRRIEITVEKRRLVVMKRGRAPVLCWCADCDGQVAMLTPDQAAAIANVSSRTIYRRVEAGEMHYLETAEGHLLVCANSLG